MDFIKKNWNSNLNQVTSSSKTLLVWYFWVRWAKRREKTCPWIFDRRVEHPNAGRISSTTFLTCLHWFWNYKLLLWIKDIFFCNSDNNVWDCFSEAESVAVDVKLLNEARRSFRYWVLRQVNWTLNCKIGVAKKSWQYVVLHVFLYFVNPANTISMDPDRIRSRIRYFTRRIQ